ncbi:MAG: FAD:protein FMN transferase [Myxococcota bacterium]
MAIAGRARPSDLHRAAFRAMGSPCEIQVFARRPEAARAALVAARADVELLEARYSRYRPDSIVAAINRAAAAGGAVDVDDETATLLDYAQACFAQSDGRFDVTSGVLRRAWRFDRGALPDAACIEALLPRVGWDRVDWRRPRLAFPVAGMEIDFGGIVKEYAVDRVLAQLLRARGVASAMVNLGGDVAVGGARPDGAPWRIGIRHPRDRDAVLATVALRAGALATSGDYERCLEVDGVRYGHILDPRSGWPVARMASVSVVADLCVVAGSVATIGMLADADGPAWLAASGLAHAWTDVDGEVGGALANAPPQRACAARAQRSGGR